MDIEKQEFLQSKSDIGERMLGASTEQISNYSVRKLIGNTYEGHKVSPSQQPIIKSGNYLAAALAKDNHTTQSV